MWEKMDGAYRSTTYAQTKDLVYEFGAGLMALGFGPCDRIALLSEGRNDWVVSELGILYNGAINVPLSVKLTPVELQFRLFHSGARAIIISGGQAAKIAGIRENLPDLKTVIYLDKPETPRADHQAGGDAGEGMAMAKATAEAEAEAKAKAKDDKKATSHTEDEYTMAGVMKAGRAFLEKSRDAFEARKKAVKGHDAANISYTSGTSADPKGIILTHHNYTANVEQALTLMHIPPEYKTLLILPLDHSFAHTAGIYSFMAKGASIGFIEAGKTPMETLRNIPQNIKELQPDLLMSVPALAKNFRKGIETAVRAKGPKVEKLYFEALATAYEYNREGYNRKKWDLYSRAKLFLFDKLLFKKIRANFGGNLKFFIGGGALLDIELQRFFYAIGIPMLQGYGLSEATPIISSNSLARHKLGSSGHLVKFLDLKILDENGKELPAGQKGEIVVRGENVMKGYWKNETATREALRDGWLHTGDMGYLDEDGFIYVLGRYKSLLIGHDGEKYSPESIEEAMADQSRFIEQVMLHNNQDPYTIGLIYPGKEALAAAVKKKGLDPKSDEGVMAAIDILEDELKAYYKGGRFDDQFPERWLPAAVGILSEGFNEENRFLNSTMKMVRGKIEDYYEDLMEYLYLPEAKNIRNERNVAAMTKLLNP
ncbi:MAG: long-chain fatty acid--CoA ligase [Balneolaceae bacterium]|nr:MAG: long-chain fatty acid--CoA ligase [Balneolaceae bacterium]